METLRTVIIGSGRYIPTRKVTNEDFGGHQFLDRDGTPFEKPALEIAQQFKQITEIAERRYVTDDLVCSDIAALAAEKAVENAGIDPETLDYIIVAHNWGDVQSGTTNTDQLPSIGARVKHKLKIKNPYCVAYDLPFGCPGWVQGMIQANYYLRSGDAKRALVIGAETLSRVIDPHDRDSLLYADGAGATIVEARPETDERVGIQSHMTRSDTHDHAFLLWLDKSYNPDHAQEKMYLKMYGRKLYRYALGHVPELVKAAIDKAGISPSDVKKILIHQANAKMDEAIVQRLFRLYGEEVVPEGIMPLTVSWLGNSSVATVPTLYDLIARGDFEKHDINPGDWLVFASVGAGMNINAFVYRVPTT